MAGRNFISNELGARILQSVSYTENIGNPTQPTKRRIVRQRGGGGAGNIVLCKILSKRGESDFNVSVQVGNPNKTSTASLPKGILYLNYATTNALAVGGELMAVTFPTISGVEGVKFDCFAIETLYNLVEPAAEEEEGEGEEGEEEAAP